MEKSATFAVVIPISYYNQAWQREWQERNPGKAVTDAPPMKATEFTKFQEDIHKKIQATLASLLPRVSSRSGWANSSNRRQLHRYASGPDSIGIRCFDWHCLVCRQLAIARDVFHRRITLLALRSFVASTRNPQNDAAFDQGFDLKLDEGNR